MHLIPGELKTSRFYVQSPLLVRHWFLQLILTLRDLEVITLPFLLI